MNQHAFRITKTQFTATAFSGEGARLYGGRWNSVGTQMVYLAGTLSGAKLEILAHTDDYSSIANLYSYFPIQIPQKSIEVLDKNTLPSNWNSPTPIAATQIIGDNWIASSSAAILEVPSAITEGEKNFLANPTHPDFENLSISPPMKLQIDPRITSH